MTVPPTDRRAHREIALLICVIVLHKVVVNNPICQRKWQPIMQLYTIYKTHMLLYPTARPIILSSVTNYILAEQTMNMKYGNYYIAIFS